jgi:hypothetical protein
VTVTDGHRASTRPVKLPGPQPRSTAWALVRQLLHDDTVSIEDRVAGLLLLLYGQPLSKWPE